MNWKFESGTGKIWGSTNNYLGIGYAGQGAGKCNPEMENVKGIGPLPHGLWKPVQFFAVHPTVGKDAVRVDPADQETLDRVKKYGRDPMSFFMHGDSIEHPGLASHGCMVEQHDIRIKFWEEKPLIDVVPGPWPMGRGPWVLPS